MDVKEAINQRRSTRHFKSDKLKEEDLGLILEAARLAPSGTNLQPWRFIVVESDKMREELRGCTLDFVADAPATIVCCVDYKSLESMTDRIQELQEVGALKGTSLEKLDASKYRGRKMSEEDTKRYLHLNLSIAIENMILQATELGLGSCWVMMFNQQKLVEVLGLDDNIEAVALLPIGYSEDKPAPRPRLSLDEIIIDRV
ncbi:oxidoreductase [Orenia metallireducens]|uniref:Oxidoreductase n=1 Tax=Orenia metallireducens TaxID=1413210 RepID=A0A1C0A726_9FIRM|nr:nitroreductase family protein [Orenia metallireducens]OCL26032.1 oxidoreductase [Orenia metallireducens]